MIDKKLSRLEQLEQDIWLNFCYYYQCELDNELIETENQSYIDQKEKIIKRMQQNDFPLSEQSAFHLEMMGDVVSIPFKPFQIAQLLMQINTLRPEVNNLPAKIFQRQYSDILIAYVFKYFSIDLLKMGLIRSKNTDLTPEDDQALEDYLWPIVKEMIKTALVMP